MQIDKKSTQILSLSLHIKVIIKFNCFVVKILSGNKIKQIPDVSKGPYLQQIGTD